MRWASRKHSDSEQWGRARGRPEKESDTHLNLLENPAEISLLGEPGRSLQRNDNPAGGIQRISSSIKPGKETPTCNCLHTSLISSSVVAQQGKKVFFVQITLYLITVKPQEPYCIVEGLIPLLYKLFERRNVTR